MDKITHEVRLEQWTQIINECLASGMNKTEWCRKNGISDKSFFYWQRRIRLETYKNNTEAALPEIADSSVSVPVQTTFVELKSPVQQAKEISLTDTFCPDIVLRKGNLNIEISNHASFELLSYIKELMYAE